MRRLQLGTAGLLLLVAVIGAGIWVDRGDESLPAARMRDRVHTTAIFASGIGGWLDSAESQAESIAAALGPWSNSPEQTADARTRLDGLVTTAGSFDDGALVVSPQFRVIASTSAKQGLVGLSRDLPNVRAALAGATAFSGVVEDSLDRAPAVTVAAPLREGSAVTGALLLGSRISGGSIGRTLERLRADSGAVLGQETVSVFLIGPSGTPVTIAGTAQSIEKDSTDVAAAVDRARHTGDGSGAFRFVGRAQIHKVAAFARLEQGWMVVSLEDESDFSAGIQTRSSIRAAIALSVLLATGLALFALLWKRLRKSEVRSEETKQAFLAITGHELRTPLTVIRGYSQTLISRWDALSEEQKAELVQTIGQHARTLENLIDRLILAAQLEAGLGVRTAKRPTDIARSLERAIAQQSSTTQLHHFEIDVEDPLIAEAESKSVEQIFEQLIENAIRYSPHGGTIRVTGRRVDGTVEVAVEDEGVGLPSDLSGIFEKFVQGNTSGTRLHDEGGVGLGLFIARSQLDALGGRIRAERREPGGARFVVTLRANPTEYS